MPRIVLSDDTNAYTGRTLAERPLGGTESSVIHLAEALARRGHQVTALTRTADRTEHAGVEWAPLSSAPELAGVDLHIATQHPRLFGLIRRPRRLAVWLIWPVNNLRHYKRVPVMWRYRPVPVFASRWQAETYSWLLPPIRDEIVIPLAVEDAWRGSGPRAEPPPPRAVYGSMPGRGLPWLLPLWQHRVLPQVPGAELHVLGVKEFGGDYGGGLPHLPWLDGLSEAARASVQVYPTLPRDEQRAVLRDSRVMLYRGHRSEAFCLSVAEAQALGVPAVVGRIAVLPERVRDGETGFIRDDPDGFSEAAVRLLRDDALWRRQHEASLAHQQGPSWDEVAARFEQALL